MKLVLSLVLSLFIFCTNVYSTSFPFPHGDRYTDQQVAQIASERGVLPSTEAEIDIGVEVNKNNQLIHWIILDRLDKLELVHWLRTTFREEQGVTIKNTSKYYVDGINAVICTSLEEESFNDLSQKGLLYIFKVLAMMRGDFYQDRDKIESFKIFIGEEVFKAYKKECPLDYKYLLEVNK
ncbi:MAG: hypothetical protein HQ538_02190 [Parcubacteria group bacterium]|nr:hypothetical protein [Parcubacteria group bacterium]